MLVLVARDIAMYLHEPAHAPFVLIILESLWVHRALEDMLTIIVANSHFGKRSAARVMTIFRSHVVTHVSESVNSY